MIDKFEFRTNRGHVGTVREPTVGAVVADCPWEFEFVDIFPGAPQTWEVWEYDVWGDVVNDRTSLGEFEFSGPPDIKEVEEFFKDDVIIDLSHDDVILIDDFDGAPVGEMRRVEN